jgi:hypothetical protein
LGVKDALPHFAAALASSGEELRMRIKRVPSTNLRRDHDELVAVLELCEAFQDGERMVVGVRNHYGDICLKIETSGAQEYMNVISCLDGREMQDELADADGPRDGYDAIFS